MSCWWDIPFLRNFNIILWSKCSSNGTESRTERRKLYTPWHECRGYNKTTMSYLIQQTCIFLGPAFDLFEDLKSRSFLKVTSFKFVRCCVHGCNTVYYYTLRHSLTEIRLCRNVQCIPVCQTISDQVFTPWLCHSFYSLCSNLSCKIAKNPSFLPVHFNFYQ